VEEKEREGEETLLEEIRVLWIKQERKERSEFVKSRCSDPSSGGRI